MAEAARIAFEDAWLLVVDKPHGQPTQAARDGEPGLYEVLRRDRGEVYLHHRLDQTASGLVLFTKQAAVNAPIAAAFREHRVARGYRAALAGRVEAGVWRAPVHGEPAETRVEIEGRGAGLSLVRLELVTGRKHQIRVHAALAGTPVVGDRRYGGDAGRAWPRLALHAATLGFTHPATGEPIALTSELPADLAPLWARVARAVRV